jgi:hypothetical protein
MLFNARQSSQETCADLIPEFRDFGMLKVKDLQGPNSGVRYRVTQNPEVTTGILAQLRGIS